MSLIIMGHIPSLKMACDCLGLSVTVCLLPHCTHTFCVLTNVIWPWFYLANNGPRCLFISHQQKGLWKSLYIRLLPTWFSLLYTDVQVFSFYMSYFILGPNLPFREFTALLLSFLSFCISLLRFSIRETQKEIVRGFSSGSLTFWLWDLQQVPQLSRGSASPSASQLRGILSNHICECTTETAGTLHKQAEWSGPHTLLCSQGHHHPQGVFCLCCFWFGFHTNGSHTTPIFSTSSDRQIHTSFFTSAC